MPESLVLYEIRETAAVITLNRPDRRNALSRDLIAAIAAAFDRAAGDQAARSVVLTGGGTAFCAGMDLDELRGLIDRSASEEVVGNDALRLSQLYDQIYRFPKPTIAAVNGPAVAGGAGLVTVCDLAIGVPGAKLGYPEVRRGLVAAMVMPHLLRHVGERMARWLLLTGDLIDAAEAERVGLVNQVVPSESLFETVLATCRSLAQGGPKALTLTKAFLARCSPCPLTVEELARASAEPRLTEECRQGLRAFFDKASAPWSPP